MKKLAISLPLTAAAILARLLTVDGASSGLDADLLDGQHGSYYRDVGNMNAGTLAVARGGTGVASYTAGDILYASGTTALSKLGIGASGTFLKSTGSAPSWSALAAGDIASGVLSPTYGGTGVNNGSFTLTIPATGTAALLGTANVFTAANAFNGAGAAVLTGAYTAGVNLQNTTGVTGLSFKRTDQTYGYGLIGNVSVLNDFGLYRQAVGAHAAVWYTADGTTLSVPMTTTSGAFNTGALVVGGGIGVAGTSYFGDATGNKLLVLSGASSGTGNGAAHLIRNGVSDVLWMGNKSAIVGGAYDATPYFFVGPSGSSTLQISGALAVLSSTASTSTSTGALVVTGGLGVGGNIACGSFFCLPPSGNAACGIRSVNASQAQLDLYDQSGGGFAFYRPSGTTDLRIFSTVVGDDVVRFTGSDRRTTVLGPLTIATSTPASAAASGVAGTIAWDSSFIYLCTATNTWKRAALATW